MGKKHSGIRQTPCDSWRIKKNQFVCIMVFKATCSNNISVISWWSVLLVEETRGPGENHWQTLSHDNVVPTTSVVIGIDCIGSCKSNYQMITTTTTPQKKSEYNICCEKVSDMKMYFKKQKNNPDQIPWRIWCSIYPQDMKNGSSTIRFLCRLRPRVHYLCLFSPWCNRLWNNNDWNLWHFYMCHIYIVLF